MEQEQIVTTKLKNHWANLARTLSGKHVLELSANELQDLWRLQLSGYSKVSGGIVFETPTF